MEGSLRKPVDDTAVRVLVADMDSNMQSSIIEYARGLFNGELEKGAKEKEVAVAMRSFLDQQYGKVRFFFFFFFFFFLFLSFFCRAGM